MAVDRETERMLQIEGAKRDKRPSRVIAKDMLTKEKVTEDVDKWAKNPDELDLRYWDEPHVPKTLGQKTNILEPLRKKLQKSFPNAEIIGRGKKLHSLVGKLQSKNKFKDYSLGDITDFVGLRITVSTLEEEREIGRRLEKNFKILEKDDYIANKRGDGYRSIHYIIEYNRKPAEIQLRTPLQTAWANFGHNVVYKDADITKAKIGSTRFKMLERKMLELSRVIKDIEKLNSPIEPVNESYGADGDSVCPECGGEMNWMDECKECGYGEEDEVKQYNITVPYVIYFGYGPVEATSEDDAVFEWNHNRRKYPRLLNNRGDLGSPIMDYDSGGWQASATEVIEKKYGAGTKYNKNKFYLIFKPSGSKTNYVLYEIRYSDDKTIEIIERYAKDNFKRLGIKGSILIRSGDKVPGGSRGIDNNIIFKDGGWHWWITVDGEIAEGDDEFYDKARDKSLRVMNQMISSTQKKN